MYLPTLMFNLLSSVVSRDEPILLKVYSYLTATLCTYIAISTAYSCMYLMYSFRLIKTTPNILTVLLEYIGDHTPHIASYTLALPICFVYKNIR